MIAWPYLIPAFYAGLCIGVCLVAFFTGANS